VAILPYEAVTFALPELPPTALCTSPESIETGKTVSDRESRNPGLDGMATCTVAPDLPGKPANEGEGRHTPAASAMSAARTGACGVVEICIRRFLG
jgi:hypothetical protein